jgi:DNA primase large subunit
MNGFLCLAGMCGDLRGFPSDSPDLLCLFLFEQIPFADALDLFRGRKVYLEGGFAYVPLKDIVAIVLNEFRAKLSKALAVRISLYFYI